MNTHVETLYDYQVSTNGMSAIYYMQYHHNIKMVFLLPQWVTTAKQVPIA